MSQSTSQDQHQDQQTGVQRHHQQSQCDTQKILEDVASGTLSSEDALGMIGQNDGFTRVQRRRPVRTPFLKVTKNGAVAAYNIQRKPVVLYADQWETLFAFLGTDDNLENFLEQNDVKRR